MSISLQLENDSEFWKQIATDYANDEPMPVVPKLPRKVNLLNHQIQAQFRNATDSDSPSVWSLVHASMEAGIGYGLDEFPCYEAFEMFFKSQYGIIVEEQSTGLFIAYIGMQELWPPRRLKNKVGSTMIIVHQEFRSRGLYQNFCPYLDELMTDVGLTGVLSDSFLINLHMHEGQRKIGFTRVGIVPGSAIVQGHGLADSVLSYMEVDQSKSLEEKLKLLHSRV